MEITNTVQGAKMFCERSIAKQVNAVKALVPNSVCVLAGVEGGYDEAFCSSNNIELIHLGQSGATIVAFPGNVEVGHFTRDFNFNFGKEVEQKVVGFLSERGLDVTVDKNDTLVDGRYKVFSWSRHIYNMVAFTAVHVSINCDEELVRKICTKPMAKIPKGLADYGITTEEMLALIEGCLEGVSDADAIYQ